MYLRLRVGALMKERGISEEELYKRAKVARNTVRALSRNSNTRVDFAVLERIAAALDVRPMELFEESENPRGQLVPALAAA